MLCTKTYTAEQVKQFSDMVKQEYRVHWLVDGLPSATATSMSDSEDEFAIYYDLGFFLGILGTSVEDNSATKDINYINNHVNIKLLYNEDPDQFKGIRIVGFEVDPQSLQFDNPQEPNCKAPVPFQKLAIPDGKDSLTVAWTYSVHWEVKRCELFF